MYPRRCNPMPVRASRRPLSRSEIAKIIGQTTISSAPYLAASVTSGNAEDLRHMDAGFWATHVQNTQGRYADGTTGSEGLSRETHVNPFKTFADAEVAEVSPCVWRA